MGQINSMKEILKNNGWVNYRTGCACVGLPRYWKNGDRPTWIVITRGNSFSINENNVQLYRGVEREFIAKMKEYNLIL